MNRIEDLKTVVMDIDSSTMQQIISQGENFTTLPTKEESAIEDSEKVCNSVGIIKQEFYENDNSYNLLSIKQEELNIKDENLDQSSFSSQCGVSGKPDFNLNTSSGSKTQKKFTCNDCDYKCRKRSSLNYHLAMHTGKNLFCCAFCEYKCTQQWALQSHVAKHVGEKPFSCTICDYKCVRKWALESHVAKHIGEKPFSCTFCDYKCVRKLDFNCHVAKHRREEQFSCTFCDRKFVKKCNLVRHLKTHMAEKASVPNVASKTLIIKNNEVLKEDINHVLPKALQLDLDQTHVNLQISRNQVVTIKQEEIDIKEEPL